MVGLYMIDYNTRLAIISNDDYLLKELKKKFEDKDLLVETFLPTEAVNFVGYNYIIVDLLKNYKDFHFLENNLSNAEAKIIVLMPLLVSRSEKYITEQNIKKLLSINSNLGVILIPELVGEKAVYDPKLISHYLVMKSLASERIKIPEEDFLINTVSYKNIFDKIVRETFSFGVSGKRLAIIGPRKGAKDFVIESVGIDKSNIVTTKTKFDQVEIEYDSATSVNYDSKKVISLMSEAFKSQIKRPVESRKKRVVSKNLYKFFFRLLQIFVILIMVPAVLIILSSFSLFFSISQYQKNPDLSVKVINLSSEINDFLYNINFGGKSYFEIISLLNKSTVILKESFVLGKNTGSLISMIMSDNGYDIDYYSDTLSASLDKMFTDVNFLQSDINELNGFGTKIIKKNIMKHMPVIQDLKIKIYQAKNITSRLSNLLGVDSPKKYMIIFQNNMEIRPTGGFIGSFALVTFDKGKLSEIVVNDVYSADGQLQGHVEPPGPIKEHLGEAGWYMRDSNWDVDFENSAKKIEWFLDKEVNQKIDGIVSVDLNFVRKLLNITGPIRLNDYNLILDSNNLYQMVQSEVEDDFFPGSIKKASFLTALSRALITEVENFDINKHFMLLSAIYNSFEEKHVQMYIKDDFVRESLVKLGYAGKVELSQDCGIRCLRNSYMLVDANLGVNKANYFVDRSHTLNQTISRDGVLNELIVDYTNSASIELGKSGTYKTYTRLILPMGASFLGVRLYDSANSYQDIKYDSYKTDKNLEVGFLVEVMPSNFKKVQLAWKLQSIELQNGGEIDIKILKQPGTESEKLIINTFTQDLSLTGKPLQVYNTKLVKDYKLKLFLK